MAKRTYKTVVCGLTKTDAKKKQKKMQDAGKTARLKKAPDGKRWCVTSAGKRKTAKKRK